MRAAGSYRSLSTKDLRRRIEALRDLQSPCALCPRRCGALRHRGQTGFCGIPSGAWVSSWGLHFGEEGVLVGVGGSGTVFLTGCNLGCVFCQNYTISHLRQGRSCTPEELASIMLALQAQGAENINWVTPTHQVPDLVHALAIAVERGLSIPLVYNCGGYEGPEALQLLEGVVDIYLPDAKFADLEVASAFCGARDYFARACRAIRLMHRQVGPLQLDARGVAVRGVLVRHLVMPGRTAASHAWARALRRVTGGDCFVNVMAQYRPQYRAMDFAAIARPVSPEEVREARAAFLAEDLRLVE